MKSKGIHGLSHILIDKCEGQVPQSFEVWKRCQRLVIKNGGGCVSHACAFQLHCRLVDVSLNLTSGKKCNAN
jgi:endonuclease-3